MTHKRFSVVAVLLSIFVLAGCSGGTSSPTYDVVVYGGSSSGVIAAVQAARMGRSVALISPREHIGGMSSSGLGRTDIGRKETVGGLTREFYRRVKDHYDQPSAWTHEDPGDYKYYSDEAEIHSRFEPHVAEKVFDQMVAEEDIKLVRGERLDREDGVDKQGKRIRAIETLSGKTYSGHMFIDATYVGDLFAAAGVSYTVGRESNEKYNEMFNGVQKGVRHHGHFFIKDVDPYVEPGNPESGLLPHVQTTNPGPNGTGDDLVQAYNYRLCMTKMEENRVPFKKPKGYDPDDYELMLRNFEAGDHRWPMLISMLPNKKTDTNNRTAFSTDCIGCNYAYPEASYEKREQIETRIKRYTQGFFWTLQNNPRVPEDIRTRAQEWGLAKDEFTDNGHWPYMPYVREGRRMIGKYVMTEQNCLRQRDTPNSVGLGSYTIDSHNVQRYVTEDGHVQNEGDFGIHPGDPYEIAYGSLVPKKDEVRNLLVPVGLSASHVAFGSIRMEPVFMILGQSAATAAVQAIENDVPVQEVEYNRLKKQLRSDGQRLTTDAAPKKVVSVPDEALPAPGEDGSENGFRGHVFEIEDMDITNAPILENEDASGGKLVEMKHENSSAETTVTLDKGEYVMVLFARGKSSDQDATYVQLGSRQRHRVYPAVKKTVMRCVGNMYENIDEAGEYTVRVQTAETGVELDRLVILPVDEIQ
jgi:hypothetical protein